jgi:hypothetical protein
MIPPPSLHSDGNLDGNRYGRATAMPMGASLDEDILPTNHRQALADACDRLIDMWLDELAAIMHGDWSVANSAIAEALPRSYLLSYTPIFAKQFYVCLITVALKLAQPRRVPLTCVAEELAARALIEEAEQVLEEDGQEANFDHFVDVLVEDIDFLILFGPKLDGLKTSAVGRYLGMGYVEFKDWFVPFGSGDRGAVHPFVEDRGDSDR